MKKFFRFQIGLRTIKTAVAVIISMLLVAHLGTSSSKLIFAMLGAMAAVQPNFKSSLESCLTQAFMNSTIYALSSSFVS